MPFTIPDQGEGDSNLQSILWQEELEVLHAGLAGIDCVLSGLAVTGGADMTPAVAKGAVLSNRTLFAVAAADVTITTADATNPRLDLIVVTSAGALAVRAGTPAAFVEGASAPKPPARTANDVVIAMVYVPAGDTAIGTSQIIDKRTSPSRPQTIQKVTTNTATNNTTARVVILTVTVPNGLMAAGNMLEFFVTGTMLLNSGTPTVTFTITYGAVTIYSDVSGATTADLDRRSWLVHGMIMSEANADQKCNGHFQTVPVAGSAAPTTGRSGDFFTTSVVCPFACNLGTVDSDTANRVFDIGWTMSVAAAANEVDVEGSFVRLI